MDYLIIAVAPFIEEEKEALDSAEFEEEITGIYPDDAPVQKVYEIPFSLPYGAEPSMDEIEKAIDEFEDTNQILGILHYVSHKKNFKTYSRQDIKNKINEIENFDGTENNYLGEDDKEVLITELNYHYFVITRGAFTSGAYRPEKINDSSQRVSRIMECPLDRLYDIYDDDINATSDWGSIYGFVDDKKYKSFSISRNEFILKREGCHDDSAPEGWNADHFDHNPGDEFYQSDEDKIMDALENGDRDLIGF